MNKRIDRFRNFLETSNEKITFVRKSHGSHHHNEYDNVVNDIDDAINLYLLLLKKYPNLIYEIHVILICDKCFTNIIINENKYGIHINLSEISSIILDELMVYIKYVNTQEIYLNNAEKEKEKYKNTFFLKDNKEITL